jgi:DNA repair exonuclease SbcCD ATPase subunit
MLWYFFDYESWSKHKNSKPGVQFSSSGSGDKEDNHELQTKLMEANNKQQILEERLKAAEDRSQELESKEKDHIERQQQCDAKEKELAAREEDLETKQNAALAKERELEARERAMVEKEAVIGGRDSKGDEGSQEEIQNLRDEVTRLRTDMKRTSAERDRLKAKEMELAKLQQAYKELKQSDEDAGSKSTSSDANENSIVGGRIQSDFREEGAARVGSRDTPPGLRTRQARPTTTRGRVAPIQLQREFTRLPRLRAN